MNNCRHINTVTVKLDDDYIHSHKVQCCDCHLIVKYIVHKKVKDEYEDRIKAIDFLEKQDLSIFDRINITKLRHQKFLLPYEQDYFDKLKRAYE